MENKAKEILLPKKKGIFRAVFLYVGQGESTLLIIPEGEDYRFMSIDSNLGKEVNGINLGKLLKDLLDEKLEIFVNTHPHKDHLGGIKEIYETVGIKEIWHSGHIPGGEHKDAYEEFKEVMKEAGEENIYTLKGSREENKLDDELHKIGDIDFNILAPAEYVSDEIEDEEPEERYKRIHEQSGVIRFSYGVDPTRILITGDSDLNAWENHITDYHKERLPSNVLSASHHGSRTFFKEKEDDEKVYTDHIESIDPTYLIISAPKQSESKHDHPHKDAIEIYKEYIDEDNIFHLGDMNGRRKSIIVDIYPDGRMEVNDDEELINCYGFDEENGGKSGKKVIIGSTNITQLDRKPMG